LVGKDLILAPPDFDGRGAVVERQLPKDGWHGATSGRNRCSNVRGEVNLFMIVQGPVVDVKNYKVLGLEAPLETALIKFRFGPGEADAFVATVGDPLPTVLLQELRQVAVEGVLRLHAEGRNRSLARPERQFIAGLILVRGNG
jgi:hypothetical protein